MRNKGPLCTAHTALHHARNESSRSVSQLSEGRSRDAAAVAYINYEKASAAAMAIEGMHEKVLNDGRGPMVKVMFAEAPKSGQG